MNVYLVRIEGVDAAGNVTTWRFTTEAGRVINEFYSAVWNPHFYEGRVRHPGQYKRTCHGDGKTFGLPPIGYGTIELGNSDGGLDELIDYGFDGQALLIRRFKGNNPDDAIDGATYDLDRYDHYAGVLAGTMDQPQADMGKFTMRIRDALQNLDVPLQPSKFAGDNVLPDGLEGTADDLQGKPKPILLGQVFNAAPPCVNTSRRIYQLHCLGFYAVTGSWTLAVYDKRSPVTAGAEKTLAQFEAGATTKAFTADPATDVLTVTAHGYATGAGASVLADGGGTLPAGLADNATYFVRNVSANTITLHGTKAGALANTGKVDITDAGSGTFTISDNRTALGCYDWCNDAAGFYIRLGNKPEGQLTVDALNPYWQNNANAHATRVSAIAEALFEISGANVLYVASGTSNYYDRVNEPDSIGLWVDQEATVLKALEPLINSVGYFVAADESSPYYEIMFGQVGYYTSTTVTLTERDILGIERIVSADEDRGIPAWRVNLHYKRNHTVMSRDQLATDVSDADAEIMSQEWRVATAEDAAVKTQYPNAPEINRYSLLNDAADADTEAARILAQYGVRRDVFKVRVHEESLTATTVVLGKRVSLTYPRFGMDAGVYLWIVGIQRNHLDRVTELTLWK